MGRHPVLVSPTSSLPPLKRLVDHNNHRIRQALQSLRDIYFSPAPPTPTKLRVPKRQLKTRIHDKSVPDSGYASAEEEDDVGQGEEEGDIAPELDEESDEADPDILRSDQLERAFAVKWLTGFISRSDDWISVSADEEEENERLGIIDEVTSLLAKFAGDDLEETGALTRTFSFPTSSSTVEVELNDAALSKEDHTSVGLQSWASSIVLATRMCLQPDEYGLTRRARVLELGAGTGLLSIVAAKLLGSQTGAIVATDYHPDVLDNLRQNIATNFPFSSVPPIEVRKLDWEQPDFSASLGEPFDAVLAADVIYHPEHASWIKRCVERLLVRPCPQAGREGGVCWLAIPMRTVGRHEGMGDTVSAVFPTAHTMGASRTEPELAILSEEHVGRQEGVGRADEGGYRIFKIGWV
ncbi:S-adenosyl-L-methionine-dependent methyltransferase [Heliocybe sulcata]|uniref:S-adenosyl-L-methionine-dependent methyltransferase n=1 Tax=Heliocybe sulcata TaxID=5364 RepID=A0A5C3NJX8_9AGAM|nr:S-adenosyl-L-methionine-dependent methyltransferase [Heliocybe sulcata]